MEDEHGRTRRSFIQQKTMERETMKTNIKAGRLSLNHSTRQLRLKTSAKAGGLPNRNQTQMRARGLRV